MTKRSIQRITKKAQEFTIPETTTLSCETKDRPSRRKLLSNQSKSTIVLSILLFASAFMPVPLLDSTANAIRVASPISRHGRGSRYVSSLRAAQQPTAHLEPNDNNNENKPLLQPERQHLVLVGGGHAHAQVIKAQNWASRPSHLKVTLIDQQASASYSGMVPGCICQRYTHDETLLHLKPLAEWAGIDFVHDKVVDIDLDHKVVKLLSDQSISFDAISIDIGSTSRGLDDVPGARDFTIPTRPISKLVQRIDQSMEELLHTADGSPRVVVIGGGAAGVELSMSLNGRFRSQVPNKKTIVTLLDSGNELLPGESPRARQVLQQIMQEQGIEVVHQCQVQELTEDSIFATIRGKQQIIPFTHCVWATGAGVHPLARRLQQKGLDATKHGWIRVNPYLQSTSHPFVFAAGDCCSIEGLPNGSPPKAGVFAVRAGPVLIENLTAFLQKQRKEQNYNHQDNDNSEKECEMKAYSPQSDFLKLIVCGDGRALGLRFGQAFHGKWVMELKDKIDTNFMDLFKRDLLPQLKVGEGYDTSQYDAKMLAKTNLTAEEGAELLSRSDHNVDYQVAWGVIRSMADDEGYRNQVLSIMEQAQQPHEKHSTSAVAT
jgi:pyridine nucleotide-disulfide oxidoreductase family protein